MSIKSFHFILFNLDLLIPCEASGFPAVRTWWEFQSASNQAAVTNQQPIKSSINNSPNYINLNTKNQSPSINTKSSYQNVISNSHIHTLENGTLIIREVSKADEGKNYFYLKYIIYFNLNLYL